MKCTRCGTENRAQVKFCRHCGQQLITEQPANTLGDRQVVSSSLSNTICSNCGSVVKPNARFCSRCGSQLNVTNEYSVSQPTIQKPTATPPYQSSSQKVGYSEPMESPPPSVKVTNKKQVISQKSGPAWILGAIMGIILLIIILVILITIFIPRTLKGTGLFSSNTATVETIEQSSPTLTLTPSISPTIEPTPTQKGTVESPPETEIPTASTILSAAPQTMTVGSQVTITVSITNESEEQITPIRCDLIGRFTPTFVLAEGQTYSLTPLETDPPLGPGATATFNYILDATNAGKITVDAILIIQVNSPDHRQVILSNPINLTVQ